MIDLRQLETALTGQVIVSVRKNSEADCGFKLRVKDGGTVRTLTVGFSYSEGSIKYDTEEVESS